MPCTLFRFWSYRRFVWTAATPVPEAYAEADAPAAPDLAQRGA